MSDILHIFAHMFIRCVKKQRSNKSKVFYQYTLAQTSRVDGKVKQYSILYLGSDTLLADKENRALVLSILKSKIFGQPEIFPTQCPENLECLALSYYEKYCLKYKKTSDLSPASLPPSASTAEYHNLDINGLEVVDVRSFGAEYLCQQMLDKLDMRRCLKNIGMSDSNIKKALISIAARAIFSSSEHKTAQILDINSELVQCYRYEQKITHKKLYAIADKLYENKNKIDSFLYNQATELFNLKDKLVIFDISNTYFETSKRQSKIACHGRSKEKRNDCPIVVFTGVINAEGFIRHSRIYEGNTPDCNTLSEMIVDLEKYSGANADHTIVIDAGIATEDNLKFIQDQGYTYVCVSRKRLKDYPEDKIKQAIKIKNKSDKNEVELAVFKPEGYTDTWMYVQSAGKRKKEQSMDDKLFDRYEENLKTIKSALNKKGGIKKLEKVWERIGRAKQKHNRVSARYTINVKETEGIATEMNWIKKENKIKEDKSKGIYFLRTNISGLKEQKLWDIYNTIREVESTFRCLKTDLQIRPIHHQKDERIKSHIYLTILAYQLVNAIRFMLKQQGINYDWKNILRILQTHTIQTVVLPTDTKDIHLRVASTATPDVQKIFTATNCKPSKPAVKKYVVYH